MRMNQDILLRIFERLGLKVQLGSAANRLNYGSFS
jgi:hypothetical protein